MKRLICFLILTAMLCGLAPAYARTYSSRIEAEWCAVTNIPESENGENGLPVYRSAVTYSNGLAINHSTTAQMPEGGWYLKYDITISADGIYDLSFVTSSAVSRYTSPYSIAINDDVVRVSESMKTANSYNSNWGKYAAKAYLKQGNNTIAFIIDDYTEQSKGSTSKTVFYFDYFDVTYSEIQGIRAEGEDYFEPSSGSGIGAARDETANSALGGDKRYLKFGGNATEGETKSVKLKVYAPEAGEYKMNTICSRLGVGWAGLWDLTDESGRVYHLNAETASLIREVVPSASNAFCEYNLAAPVTLAAGYNTFTVTAYPRGSGGFATFIDYIAFEKTGAGALTIEAESCAEPGYWTAASGRLTLKQTDEAWGYDPVGDAFEIYYDFDIADENTYYFYFDMAAANSSNSSVSRMEISVDGEKWRAFDTANLVKYSNSKSGISATYSPAVYRYENRYSLEQGGHRLGLRVTEPIAADDRRLEYFAVIDKIQVLPSERSAEYMKAKINVPYVAAGDSLEAEIGIYDNYGTMLGSEEFDFEYESSNPRVAEVDSDGRITAVGIGDAQIRISAKSDIFGNVSTEAAISVISEIQGICITKCIRRGDEITIGLINPLATQSSAMLIVTEYENIDGAQKLTGVHRTDLPSKIGNVTSEELHGIMENTYTIKLNNAAALSDVYVWTDTGDMVSLCSGIVGQEG